MKFFTIILFNLILVIPQKETEIIGVWHMCKMGGTSRVEVSYNVCPTIEFKENNQGIINDKYKFKWTFKEDSIEITFEDNYISQFFTNHSIYKIERNIDSECVRLKLVNENGKWLKMAQCKN